MVNMKKTVTNGIYVGKHNNSMMMCCTETCSLTGMGGPPM